MKKQIIVLLVLALILSEVFLSLNETVGFILYSALVALCLLSLSHKPSLDDSSKLIIVLMIVPIVRIIESFITFGFFWKLIISYSILLFLSFYYSVRFKLDHGHKKEKLGFLPLAIILGVALGLLGNFFFSFDKYPWLIYLILLIAYSEEILFRGMIQNLLEKNYKPVFSILIASLLYGVFSLGYGVLFSLFMFSASVVIGLIYARTKNIFLAVGINLILHGFLFVLL
jgi:membrane protease YdiL (CAAX protease family)